MRRALAIAVFLSLLAGSAPVWSAGGCCGDSECCKNGICPMHRPQKPGAARSNTPDREPHCKSTAGVPPEQAKQCRASGECTHQPAAVQTASQLRAVLPAVLVAATLGRERTAPWVRREAPVAGFLSPPFHPPRPAGFSIAHLS